MQVYQRVWLQCDAGHSTDVKFADYMDKRGVGTTAITAVRGPTSTTTYYFSPVSPAAATQVIGKLLLKKRH
jgi:hypothetical protein